MGEKLIIVFALACGLYAAVAIFVPRIRPRWRGSNFASGRPTCAGFALACTAAGLVAMSPNGPVTGWTIVATMALLLGFVCAFAGSIVDVRANRRRGKS